MTSGRRQLNPTIGRNAELGELRNLVADPAVQLVTVTGPGGIGKTRLVLDAIGGIAIPATFVGLESIRTTDLALPAIADALQLPTRIGGDVRDEIERSLSGRGIVLILDNLEQLGAAGDMVARLLEIGPGITVLATSRSPLHVPGEYVFALDPLSIEPYAVGLFIQRAERADRSFVADASNWDVIARICERLDGIPLAIELAAARVNAIPLTALRSMLERNVSLPGDVQNGRPDRHRTLGDAIAWSFDLLVGDLQELFCAISLFEGGFSLQEAATLTQNCLDDLATMRVLSGLVSLVDASLLLRDGAGDEPRFRMLETIRSFGCERIEQVADANAIRLRHAELFLDLAEASVPAMRGAERSQWLERLDLARANLRAALDWAITQNRTELALRLAAALWPYWWWRSHVSEGLGFLTAVQHMPERNQFPELGARCLIGKGALSETRGRYAEAEKAYQDAELLIADLGDTRILAEACLFRWLVSFNADDQDGMILWSNRSLGLFRELGDRWGIAMSLMETGVMAMRNREHDRATEVLTESMRSFRMVPDSWGVAICEGVQSNVETDRRQYVRALSLQRSSLTALLSLNDLWGVVMVMPAAVRLAMELGQVDLAAQLAGATESMSARMGTPIKEPFRERFATAIDEAQRHLGQEQFNLAWSSGSATTPEAAVALAGTLEAPGKDPGDMAGAAPMIALSPREREVVRLIPTNSARAIGEQLFISESTVRTHIDNILAKFGARNQKELIAMLFQGTGG